MALDHYVSQVHLKRFYSPALDGLMYAIRKSDLKRFTPNAKAVCRIDEGNTNDFLTEPRAIEEFLKTIEGKYNGAVENLRAEKIDADTIYAIAGFTCYVMICAPAGLRIFAEPLKGMVELTAELLDGMGALPTPPTELGGENLTELIKSGAVKAAIDPKYPNAIGVSNILQRVAVFGNFPWEVLINEHEDCPFFTSDYPVAIEPTDDPRLLNRIVPLTPELAIRITPNFRLNRDRANFEFRQFKARYRSVARNEVVDINRLIVRAAEDTVFYRDDAPWVLQFIEKNRGFRIETQNTRVATAAGTMQVSGQVIGSRGGNGRQVSETPASGGGPPRAR